MLLLSETPSYNRSIQQVASMWSKNTIKQDDPTSWIVLALSPAALYLVGELLMDLLWS